MERGKKMKKIILKESQLIKLIETAMDLDIYSQPSQIDTNNGNLDVVDTVEDIISKLEELLYMLKSGKKNIMGAQHLTQQEKAKLYDDMLLRYQRLQEQVRLLKAKSFEVSDEDQRQINIIESSMKKLYNDTQKLF
jgi:hypothetical protein